ncbi:MAG: hypothetical protein KDC98_26095, partial [Planctomycetes bacterium]|nr:hypothetical protein [Planctomycetota bacterium]
MNHALQLAALGLIGTALTAQTVQITAHGTLSIDYQPLGGPVVNRSLPVAGTASLNLSSVGTSALTVGLTTTVHVTADSPPFGCYGCWSAARGDIVVEFSSPVPITAMLRLEQTPACQMSPVFLDIDNDGSWDIGTSSATSLDYPVVLGSQPLPVRIFA